LFNAAAANQLLVTLSKKYPENIYVADAVISNLKNKEAAFYQQIAVAYPNDSLAVKSELKKVLNDIASAKSNKNNVAEKLFPKGAAIFKSVCHACHGTDGNGVKSLAPPLNNSNWVLGDKKKLISIVLYGLTGPVQVNGKVYKAPEVTGDMPGIGENKEFSDEDMAQVLSYIRNSWSNKAEKINAGDVDNVRRQNKGRQTSFTVEELNRLR
jgi:mono/diheme cytochrome c family protein